MLTTEDARQKFNDLGLSYKVIGLREIDRLRQLIACELEEFLMSGTNNAEGMGMTL